MEDNSLDRPTNSESRDDAATTPAATCFLPPDVAARNTTSSPPRFAEDASIALLYSSLSQYIPRCISTSPFQSRAATDVRLRRAEQDSAATLMPPSYCYELRVKHAQVSTYGGTFHNILRNKTPANRRELQIFSAPPNP